MEFRATDKKEHVATWQRVETYSFIEMAPAREQFVFRTVPNIHTGANQELRLRIELFCRVLEGTRESGSFWPRCRLVIRLVAEYQERPCPGGFLRAWSARGILFFWADQPTKDSL